MPKSSPARSFGAPVTPRRNQSRSTRSEGSPAHSTGSGRLSSLVDQFKEKNKDSLCLSPLSTTVLSDNTEIEIPRRSQSLWKKVDNSRDVIEVLESEKPANPINVLEEFDVEVLTQEKKEYTMDLLESSDSDSIRSIALPQQARHLFGNRAGTKRKNMFADFVVSESEDEIPEIHPKIFAFQRTTTEAEQELEDDEEENQEEIEVDQEIEASYKVIMPKSSPARSFGAPVTPRRNQSRSTRSVGSPAHSTGSGRLSSLVDQFKENNKDSLCLSPLSTTVLSDNTEIEIPRRSQSLWKKVDNSRDVIEVLESEKPANPINVLEEFDVEVLTQEKKEYTMDLLESSDSDSIRSIALPQQARHLFGNRAGTKRKNMFADFVVSESEDEIPEIHPKIFAFQRTTTEAEQELEDDEEENQEEIEVDQEIEASYKVIMPKSSPARSFGAPVTPRRNQSRSTRSVGSPAHSTGSGRLSSLVDQFKENNKDSLCLSPLSTTVLSDNTEIEIPRRSQSLWKKVDNSRDVIEVLESEKPANPINVLEEFDVEVLTQEKKEYTMDLLESSDSDSIRSIALPQQARHLFGNRAGTKRKNMFADFVVSESEDEIPEIHPKIFAFQRTTTEAEQELEDDEEENQEEIEVDQEIEASYKVIMPKSSPARSFGAPVTPRRNQSRSTRSVGSPAHSTGSGRLSSLVDQFKENNKDSLCLSPLSTTVLSDNTEIEIPRRSQSLWKKVDNSRDVIEVLESEKPANPINVLEEFDVEVLTQEKKEYTMDLLESSDSDSIRSIALPQQARHLFGNRAGTKRKNMFADFVVSESEDEIPEIHPKIFAFQRTTTEAEQELEDDEEENQEEIEVDQEIEASYKVIMPKSSPARSFGAPVTPRRNQSRSTRSVGSPAHSTGSGRLSSLVDQFKENNKDSFGLSPLSTTVLSDHTEIEIPRRSQSLWKKVDNSRDVIEVLESEKPANPINVLEEFDVEVLTQEKKEYTMDLLESSDSDSIRSIALPQQARHLFGNRAGTKRKNMFADFVVSESEDEIPEIHPKIFAFQRTTTEAEQELEDDEEENQEEIEVDQEIEASYKVIMPKSSPARSFGAPVTPRRNQSRSTRSVGSPAHSTGSGRLSSLVDQFKENNKDSFGLSPLSTTVLSDHTEIEIPRRSQSLWKKVDNSRDVIEVLESEKPANPINVLEEFDVEVLTQEKKEYTMDLLESSDSDSIRSIALPQQARHLFGNRAGTKRKNMFADFVVSESEDEIPEIHPKIFAFQRTTTEAEQELEDDEEENQEEIEVDQEIEASYKVIDTHQDEQDTSQEKNDKQQENEELIVKEIEPNDEEINNQHEQERSFQNNDHEDEKEISEEQSVDDIEQASDNESQNEEVEVEYESQKESEEEDDDNNESQPANEEQSQEEEEEEEGVHESAEVEREQQEDEEQQLQETAEPAEAKINKTHDTTGRHRQKPKTNSPEAILHEITNEMDSFVDKGRNTSVRKTKNILKNFTLGPSLASARESTGLSDGTNNSSAEGSGWDSHRTTRKTLRQTFGKDFTPRKSLRALVMEKSAKRQTIINEANAELKLHDANSIELPEESQDDQDVEMYYENDIEPAESDHEVSKRTRLATLEMYLQKIKKENMEWKLKIKEQVRNSFKSNPVRLDVLNFRVPTKLAIRRANMKSSLQTAPKLKRIKPSVIALEDLPPELVEDMKYKPPKRFRPRNAFWINKRLYKFLESKLEPKYDYKARARAEKLVETIYNFIRDVRRDRVAPLHAVAELKKEMARLDIVNTHFEFYNFFSDYLPLEIKIKVVPDIVNDIPLPRDGVFAPILV